MRFNIHGKLLPGILLLSVTILLQGCAGNRQYHPDSPLSKKCSDSENPKACPTSYLQEFDDYTLAVAEFTERGNNFNDTAYADILETIAAKSKNNSDGIVIIVFVHGWGHNSREEDPNLKDFKNVLAELARKREDFAIGARDLVGVYVGWRGQSLKIPLIEKLTYWERKAVAEQLGNTGLSRLLADLDTIDQETTRNVMATVGHSFGGAAVLSAVSKPLLMRLQTPLIQTADSSTRCSNVSCGIGDGVFLINPAIEANQVVSLLESTIPKSYPENQSPLLVSISSEADLANKYAFPLGQTFGLLATSRQAPLSGRTYFKDFVSGEQLTLLEENLDSTTVGNFAPFLTHRLDVPDAEALCEAASSEELERLLADSPLLRQCSDYSKSSECGPKYFPRGFDRTQRNAFADRESPYNPLYFIRTNDKFMNGHNDIFNPHVVTFLVSQMEEALVAANRAQNKERAVLYQDPDSFRDRYLENLNFACDIEYRSDG